MLEMGVREERIKKFLKKEEIILNTEKRGRKIKRNKLRGKEEKKKKRNMVFFTAIFLSQITLCSKKEKWGVDKRFDCKYIFMLLLPCKSFLLFSFHVWENRLSYKLQIQPEWKWPF